MCQIMHTRASELMGISDSYVAWCLDEAIALLITRVRSGDQLKQPKTKDNHALLKKMGVK